MRMQGREEPFFVIPALSRDPAAFFGKDIGGRGGRRLNRSWIPAQGRDDERK
jgi:hypothetical protein